MRESVLRDYFLGLVDEQRLSEDLANSAVKTFDDVITCYVTDDFSGDFDVNASHLIRLCDGFLTGKLKAEHLELIGFALEASDHFLWNNKNLGDEDTPVAETIQAWASSEINYPLTVEIVAKFKHLLLTGKRIFTREDVTKQSKKRKD
jgi:hypothetical protein